MLFPGGSELGMRWRTELSMQPVMNGRFAQQRLALRYLVLVVREDQVVPATVDVDLFAENGQVHGRALDVPAGTAFAPRGFPGRFAGLGAFP